MNTASWIPDLFMRRVKEDGDWYMFNPNECPELHELFGSDFDKKYESYCRKADKGEIKTFEKISAKGLWKKMLKVLFETSHPWNTFKDPCNIRYTNQHEGVVHSSNLCTEITLHTKASKYNSGKKIKTGETAVCNLGSINLVNHIRETYKPDGSLSVRDMNWTELSETINIAIRMLDNVIDINFYPTDEAANSNLNNRPVGLGMMGVHDILHLLNIPIDSNKSIELNDKLFEFYSYHSILSSSKLAEERGQYKTFHGSLWDQNVLPLDSWNNLMEYRGKRKAHKTTLNWDAVRESIKGSGMRNSNVMAIAPTATIGYINGVEQSIEPNFSVLFVYENKSGNFYITNPYFVNDMKEEGLWSPKVAQLVKTADGDLSLLGENIPEWIKDKYKTAFDRDMFKLIECNAVRQKWVDQSISFNLYNKTTSLKYLNDLYMASWEAGLKTTYYLRNRAATKIEKSTESTEDSSSCSIEAMKNGESCESCQ
jgi:ribonucleoside-diphosphate reductase alpha chain